MIWLAIRAKSPTRRARRRFICVRETGAQNMVVIVDMTNPMQPARRQISADSALMCPDKKVIALKATAAGTPGDNLQVFNLDTKTKLKAFQMAEPVEFWKWTTPNQLGLVTAAAVYHWDVEVSRRGQSWGGGWGWNPTCPRSSAWGPLSHRSNLTNGAGTPRTAGRSGPRQGV